MTRAAAIVGYYLSSEHRDHPEAGCAIAALRPRAARGGPALRAAFEMAIRTYLDLLSPLMPEATDEARVKRSIATYSTMVGALLLARTVTDPTCPTPSPKSAADAVLACR